MSNSQFIIFVLVLGLAVAITRVLPFIVFSNNKKTPEIINYLGKVLPAAMMGLLVVYCFKDTDFLNISELIPVVVASIVVVVVHLWKRKTILSIVLGTFVYMLLIRII